MIDSFVLPDMSRKGETDRANRTRAGSRCGAMGPLAEQEAMVRRRPQRLLESREVFTQAHSSAALRGRSLTKARPALLGFADPEFRYTISLW